MPQDTESNDIELRNEFPTIKLIAVTESKDAALERKKRVQALLSQMFLRSQKRGRPLKHELDEELKDAA